MTSGNCAGNGAGNDGTPAMAKRGRRWSNQGEIINDGHNISVIPASFGGVRAPRYGIIPYMMSSRYFALIPAAGVGARVGAERPKQYVSLAGKLMLLHALDTFADSVAIQHTFVVVSAEDGYVKDALAHSPHLADRVTVLYCGGATRRESVLNGLRSVRGRIGDDDWVLVHDAARPGLTEKMIDRLIESVRDDEVGGLLALPVVDTLKRANAEQRAEATVPRDSLWAAQTPQMFRYALLGKALQAAEHATDEASAVEALGLKPKLVEGSARNFKVTLPHDVALAELYLKALP
jgi:2-C-methyl-D-erythritol 4-phosphate cytidylyltransferase